PTSSRTRSCRWSSSTASRRRRSSGGSKKSAGAVDDDEVGVGVSLPNDLGRLIFRAVVTRLRSLAIGELDHHIAVAAVALHHVEGAATHNEIGAEFFKGRFCRREIFRIARLVPHRDANDPIGLWH